MKGLADEALEIARGAGSSTGVACAESILGISQLAVGNLSAGEEYLERAAAVLRQNGPSFFGIWAVLMRAAAHGWQSEYAEANRVITWALENARQNGAHLLVSNLFFRGRLLANQGRISDALRSLEEAMRIGEADRLPLVHFATIPNTLGWVYSEMQHFDLALKLNSDGIQLGREVGFPEAEAYSHFNLARVYLMVGDHEQAWEHLRHGERIVNNPGNVCFPWLFNIHLRAATTEYWIDRGELRKAGSFASESLAIAETALARKHVAWAHKLLGDIAVREERLADARGEFGLALGVLAHHPCPLIEWKILLAAAETASRCGNRSEAEHYKRRCRCTVESVESLAASIADDNFRQVFLSSKPVRDL